MKKLLSIITVLSLTLSALAQGFQTPTPYAEQTWSDKEKELVDLQQKVWDLMAAKDAEGLRPIFHPEAMFVHMGGYWGTEQELQSIGSGFLWYKKAEIFHVDVKFVGDDALVYSTITLTAGLGANEVITPFYVTSLFKKVKGKWMLGSFVFTTRISGPDGNKVRIEHIN